MNKNVILIYEKALAVVLDEYGIDDKTLFNTNDEECTQARKALVIALHEKGLTDKEIAECTKKMRRCSICKIRNRYDDKTAPWTVKKCIENIKRE